MGAHNAGHAEAISANGRSYRLVVHQASGMVAAQAGCHVDVALDLLLNYAAQHQRDVDEVAIDVVEHRLRIVSTNVL